MRVVVTRALHQAEELASPLRDAGAEVILLPTIDIVSPEDPRPFEAAMARLGDYHWVIFTSTNAIDAFLRELPPGLNWQAKVATIGVATRRYAEKRGLRVNVTPEKYVSESLVAALSGEHLCDCRIFIPSAAVTRDVVPGELRKRGARVDVVEAYRNIMPIGTPQRAREVFRDPLPDWVTFASPSAVNNLVCLTGLHVLERVRLASIGPATSQTIRDHGLRVAAEANPHTIAGLVDAIV